jgi:acetoin utilization deacetylase AcuC-like enzyme
MPVVWSDQCRLHEPAAEIFVGVRTPATETAARLDAILVELGDARIVHAEPHPDDALLAVHDGRLVDYLATAWAEWEAADLGQDRVVPYVFAHEALAARAVPTAVWARPGFFAYDTMTLVGPGTWEAARAAVDVALTAVDLVVAGEPCAYACCRPAGHHATRRGYGGSCYLNNAAVAAAALRERIGGPIAVLDLDAHHGNGTQEVFYEAPDVLVGSVHVDPGAGWFPHFLGFADETGSSAGEGANRNVPLPPGAGDEPWLATVRELVGWAQEARGLVVSLGVDAAAEDPESPLRVSAGGFREAGRVLGSFGLPTVLVQEGGYNLPTLGALVHETLSGVEEAAR